jgi:predicted DNA-binding protein (UPF0278 family)
MMIKGLGAAVVRNQMGVSILGSIKVGVKFVWSTTMKKEILSLLQYVKSIEGKPYVKLTTVSLAP